MRTAPPPVNLNAPVAAFRAMVLDWRDATPGMDAVVRHVKAADLPPCAKAAAAAAAAATKPATDAVKHEKAGDADSVKRPAGDDEEAGSDRGKRARVAPDAAAPPANGATDAPPPPSPANGADDKAAAAAEAGMAAAGTWGSGRGWTRGAGDEVRVCVCVFALL